LRERGALAPAAGRRRAAGRFVRVVAAEAESGASRAGTAPLRVQLASGDVLEWAEAPAGEALRDLIGWLR